MVWVKICGITRETDAGVAAEAGADAIGVVVNAVSPRAVSPRRAVRIFSAAGKTEKVIVTSSRDAGQIISSVIEARPSALQLHGVEELGSGFIESIRSSLASEDLDGIRIMSSVGVTQGADRAELLRRAQAMAASADAILLDTKAVGGSGGTGRTHDWQISKWLGGRLSAPVILAGGLTPRNVSTAISTVRPFGVDVSTGVEVAPGVKDPDRISDFITQARRTKY